MIAIDAGEISPRLIAMRRTLDEKKQEKQFHKYFSGSDSSCRAVLVAISNSE